MRRLFAEVALGTPKYELLVPAMAAALREQLAQLQHDLLALGQLKSVIFSNVMPDGSDIFDVTLANGSLKCMIRLDAPGKLVVVADCRQAAMSAQ